MNAYRANGGYSGTEYDRWVEQRASESSDKSPMAKLQQQFWVTKQTVFRKLGKKEDECIVASDAELDAKLDLFRSIQESCQDLQRIIDKYQERLCILSSEEGALGRFLKDAGRSDKTQAGKMMSAAGKAMSYSGQQRLALRVPLLRLHQEVETFRARAVEDTQTNVRAMEKLRTEYRAALSWMKQLSSELDPDTFHQLDKFRKVQNQVRRSRARFEPLKQDCVQKIDLLTAARCNMFSHALVLYQAALAQCADNVGRAMHAVAEMFQGHQHFDFCVVKELSQLSEPTEKPAAAVDNNDKLLFFEQDFHDEPAEEGGEAAATTADDLGNLLELLDLGQPEGPAGSKQPGDNFIRSDSLLADLAASDLLGLDLDQALLSDLSPAPAAAAGPARWAEADLSDWGGGSIFGGSGAVLPSQLLARTMQTTQTMQTAQATQATHAAHAAQPAAAPKEPRAWLDLFAELDPLSDPDALAGSSDRNC